MNLRQLFIAAVLLLGSCTVKEADLAPIVFDLEKGILSGELKELADSMNEEDNPVIRIFTAK